MSKYAIRIREREIDDLRDWDSGRESQSMTKLIAIGSLDTKNAFTTASWGQILEGLNQLSISQYLKYIILHIEGYSRRTGSVCWSVPEFSAGDLALEYLI